MSFAGDVVYLLAVAMDGIALPSSAVFVLFVVVLAVRGTLVRKA